MEINSNRKSLGYAGAVLLFFVLLTHLTVSRPDGGIISSIGILIVSLFQLVVWVIALPIGLAVCIAVMLCIFIASAYIVDSQLGKGVTQRTKNAAFAQVRWLLAVIAPGKFGELQPAVAYSATLELSERFGPGAVIASASPARDAQEPVQVVQASATSEQLAEMLQKVEAKLQGIETSVQNLESNSVQFARTDQLEAMGLAVQTADERSRAALDIRISPVQDQLEQMSKQNEELLAANKKLGDIVLRTDTLEQKASKLAELPQQVSELRDELASKYEAIQQQVADLRGQVQQQIGALKPKPAVKGRTHKKNPAQSS